MIERDPAAAVRAAHQLIVIGGGIYGITLALEAARRGLRPLLLERGDFGHATSWNSLRIVHGGLRYLQTLDLHRHRESVTERSWLLREFPDLVRPLPCLMPLFGDGVRRPSLFRLALEADHLLSRRRNRGLREDRRVPKGTVLGVEGTLQVFPAAERRGLVGGALWYDAVMPDSQRLLIEMLHWAVACGARALNYVEAIELETRRGRVTGVRARDVEGGDQLEFQSPVVVNCAGPWSGEIARRFDRETPELFFPSLAFNVLLDRPPLSEAAVAVRRRAVGAQTYFLLPWKGRILAGTCHAALADGERVAAVPREQLESFIAELNAAVPGIGLQVSEVRRLFWGFLPAAAAGSTALAVRERIVDHGTHGGPQGLVSISGVKFTTARRVAEKALVPVLSQLGEANLAATARPPRPEPRRTLSASELEALLRSDRPRARREVTELMHEEAVMHLDDLLLRRTDWGMDPGASGAVAAEMSSLLGWDRSRTELEMARLAEPGIRSGS